MLMLLRYSTISTCFSALDFLWSTFFVISIMSLRKYRLLMNMASRKLRSVIVSGGRWVIGGYSVDVKAHAEHLFIDGGIVRLEELSDELHGMGDIESVYPEDELVDGEELFGDVDVADDLVLDAD